ncbi:MAG: hypothetical protein WBN83_03310 [Desulfoprunum sp.]|jgi:hypothetical protein|uniref:hypothetical protein n=1 Tax=Desulfoprunum sp. TaxID=2020866 RepID=UPI00052E07C0|nr:hypothetical protein JT06_15300 [Desulfobulbus sp. Tol-SR]
MNCKKYLKGGGGRGAGFGRNKSCSINFDILSRHHDEIGRRDGRFARQGGELSGHAGAAGVCVIQQGAGGGVIEVVSSSAIEGIVTRVTIKRESLEAYGLRAQQKQIDRREYSSGRGQGSCRNRNIWHKLFYELNVGGGAGVYTIPPVVILAGCTRRNNPRMYPFSVNL